MKRLTLIFITLTSCMPLIADNINAHRSLVDEHTAAATNKCQKACIKEVQAIIDVTPTLPESSNGKKFVTGHVINVTGNKVGIDEGDTCAVFEMPLADGKTATSIICSSGKCFEDVCSKEGAATGTPGFLMYGTTYIGSYYHPKAASGMPGADRRTDYCLKEYK